MQITRDWDERNSGNHPEDSFMGRRQLIIIADMEGASGIVDYTKEDRSAICPEEI